jgi:predicted membrane protein
MFHVYHVLIGYLKLILKYEIKIHKKEKLHKEHIKKNGNRHCWICKYEYNYRVFSRGDVTLEQKWRIRFRMSQS